MYDRENNVLTLTDRQIIIGLEAAVKHRGKGWVYPDEWRIGNNACLNFVNNRPACIAGWVYYHYGVPSDTEGWRHGSVGFLRALGMLNITDAGAQMLQVAQGAQDAGDDWGTAVKAALREPVFK